MVSKLHGKVITANHLRDLPDRNYLAQEADPPGFDEVEQVLSHRKPLLFMPNAVSDDNFKDDQTYSYRIVVAGSLIDGRATTVVINGINPYFYVLLDSPELEKSIVSELSNLKLENFNRVTNEKLSGYFTSKPTCHSVELRKRFIGYRSEQEQFLRLEFTNMFARRNALNYLRAKRHKTFADSTSKYYRAVCSEYQLSFASWVQLHNYNINCNHPHIKGMVISLDVSNYIPYSEDILKNNKLMNDRTLGMSWDIETYSPSGKLPSPFRKEDRIFMIGITFHWYWSKQALFKICLVDSPSKEHPDFLTVTCQNEEEMLMAFADIFEKMSPSIVLAFNNYDYDYPWIFQRACQLGVMAEMLQKMDLKKQTMVQRKSKIRHSDGRFSSFEHYANAKIKVDADNEKSGNYITVAGVVNTDVMIVFRQLYPKTSEYSLNFFLQKHGLGSKLDMPVHEMFSICESTDADRPERMSKIAEYCIMDCQKTHELLLARLVIKDRREIARLSFTSLTEAFNNADAMKVRNLVMSQGIQRGFVFTDSVPYTGEKKTYQGALVFPPLTDLVRPKLTMRQRKHIADNMPETEAFQKYKDWQYVSLEAIEKYESSGKAHESDPACVQAFFRELSEYPVFGLDFSSLYPSLIMCYNLSPEYMLLDVEEARSCGYKILKIDTQIDGNPVVGYCIQHENNTDETQPEYRFGLYPHILRMLFNERSRLKKVLIPLKEKYEQLTSERHEKLDVEHLEEQINYWDSKQRALKVFMNTFYGEAGNNLSPLYMREISSGITWLGQSSLLKAKAFVENKKCKVHYGDTDSLYISMAPEHFYDLDQKYYSNKCGTEEYCTELVNRTFELAKSLQKEINAWFREDNGTDFLKMAYEEVLMPAMFQTKKKYFGRPHENIANFESKLFIRGLEIQKRTTYPFLTHFMSRILNESMSLNNLFTMMDLVKICLKEVCTQDWVGKDKLDMFVRTAKYSKDKKNISVQTFAERMKDKGIILKPGERFKYVIVEKYDWEYDAYGVQKKLAVGDRMELYDVVLKNKDVIDIRYYVTSLIGQLVHFVMYECFNGDKNKATRYLSEYASQFMLRCVNLGPIYKKFASQVNRAVKKTKTNAKSADAFLQKMKQKKRNEYESVVVQFFDTCFPLNLSKVSDRSRFKELQQTYIYGDQSVLAIQKRKYQAVEKELYPKLNMQLSEYNSRMEQMIQENRSKLLKSINLDALRWMDPCVDTDSAIKQAMAKIGSIPIEIEHMIPVIDPDLITRLESAYASLCEAEIIADHLRDKSNRYLKVVRQPSLQELNSFAKEFANVNLRNCNL